MSVEAKGEVNVRRLVADGKDDEVEGEVEGEGEGDGEAEVKEGDDDEYPRWFV